MRPVVTAGVARVVAAMTQGKTELDPQLGGQVASALAKAFNVRPEEVAILLFTGGGMNLQFVVPAKLARLGTVPMTSNSSLAVRTVREGKAEVINNFSATSHPTVFEGVKLRRGEPSEPIQKIVSVPIAVSGTCLGVIQVSRKGKNPAAAGADFSTKDLDVLTQVAAVLAGCLEPR